MDYVKGDFRTYVAKELVHLGSIAKNIEKGEEVLFDGFTLKLGGQEFPMHQFRGAIKAGWLLAEGEEARPMAPPEVVMHRANGKDRTQLKVIPVTHDDVDMGSLQSLRPQNAPKIHKAARAGTEQEGEGVVVARMKTPTTYKNEVGKDDREIVRKLENDGTAKKYVEPVFTGDVEEPIEGDELEDLLPKAASSGRPKVAARAPKAEPAQAMDPLDRIQMFIPGFQWQMTGQWKQRAKVAVDRWAHVPAVLEYIQSVETDAVKAEIAKRLSSQE